MISLAYHSVNYEDNPICITPEVFESQIRLLSENGFTSITTANLSFENDKVLITFDDGFKNVYTSAFPILEKYGYKGTVFINPFNIGKEDIRLSWRQLKELSENGWSVQSHSFSHEILTRRINETSEQWKNRITNDILNTKYFFSENLSFTPEYFAYPFGIYSKSLEEILKVHGFKNSFSVNEGLNTNSNFTLKRFNISGTEAVNNFKNILFYKELKIFNLSFEDGQEISNSENISGTINLSEEVTAPINFKIITSSVFNSDFIDSIDTELIKSDGRYKYSFSINFKKSLNYGFYTLKIEGKIGQVNYINAYSFLSTVESKVFSFRKTLN